MEISHLIISVSYTHLRLIARPEKEKEEELQENNH